MKLRNKLIPLLSAATITTAITPIMTSCSNGMVDITAKYLPTIEKAEKTQEALTDAQAQDIYFEHLAKNPDILRQDVLAYESSKMPSRIRDICFPNGSEVQKYVVTNMTAKVSVDGISARKVEAVVDNAKVLFYALSCKIHYVYNYTAVSIDSRESKTINFEFTSTLKDIPTEVVSTNYFNPTRENQVEKRWSISNNFLNRRYLKAVPGWSYTFSRNQTTTTNTVTDFGETRTKTDNNDKSGIINRESQILDLIKLDPTFYDYFSEYLRFESYHLSNIVPSEPVVDGIKLAVNANNHFELNYDNGDMYLPLMYVTGEAAEKLADPESWRMTIGESTDNDTWTDRSVLSMFEAGQDTLFATFPTAVTSDEKYDVTDWDSIDVYQYGEGYVIYANWATGGKTGTMEDLNDQIVLGLQQGWLKPNSTYTFDAIENPDTKVATALAQVGTEYGLGVTVDGTETVYSVTIEEPIYHIDLTISE